MKAYSINNSNFLILFISFLYNPVYLIAYEYLRINHTNHLNVW